MLVFSLAGAPLSVSQDATRAVNLLYCRSPKNNLQHLFLVKSLEDNGPYSSFCLKTRFVGLNNKSANSFAVISHMIFDF